MFPTELVDQNTLAHVLYLVLCDAAFSHKKELPPNFSGSNANARYSEANNFFNNLWGMLNYDSFEHPLDFFLELYSNLLVALQMKPEMFWGDRFFCCCCCCDSSLCSDWNKVNDVGKVWLGREENRTLLLIGCKKKSKSLYWRCSKKNSFFLNLALKLSFEKFPFICLKTRSYTKRKEKTKHYLLKAITNLPTRKWCEFIFRP